MKKESPRSFECILGKLWYRLYKYNVPGGVGGWGAHRVTNKIIYKNSKSVQYAIQ